MNCIGLYHIDLRGVLSPNLYSRRSLKHEELAERQRASWRARCSHACCLSCTAACLRHRCISVATARKRAVLICINAHETSQLCAHACRSAHQRH